MFSFFQTCSFLDVLDIEELLLKRYHDIHYILEKEWSDGLLFILKAKEKENEDVIFQMYLHDIGNGLSFDEYKKKMLKQPYKKMEDKEVEELVSKAERILHRERGDADGAV